MHHRLSSIENDIKASHLKRELEMKELESTLALVRQRISVLQDTAAYLHDDMPSSNKTKLDGLTKKNKTLKRHVKDLQAQIQVIYISLIAFNNPGLPSYHITIPITIITLITITILLGRRGEYQINQS